MWYKRDFKGFQAPNDSKIQVRVLRGPRQVGKTSLIDSLGLYQLVLFDDHILRQRAQENPSLFLDQFKGRVLLDEASMVPAIFFEIKKRVDHAKRELRKGKSFEPIDL